MFENDPEREAYTRLYEADLVDHLQRMVQQVDTKIKKSLARAENPV